MKSLLVLFVMLAINIKAQIIQPALIVSPSGYYSLDNKTTLENGETYGYFGIIKVKQVDSNRIFVDFYVCKGAPTYNSGSFEDTLLYKKGIAAYTTSDDNSCIITFNFNTSDGVIVKEKSKDSNSGCGFGSGVIATGFYKKIMEQCLKVEKQ